MLSVSVEFINEIIDSVLASANVPSSIVLSRVVTADEWKSLKSSVYLAGTKNDILDNDNHPPYYFGIQVVASSEEQFQTPGQLIGFCTFYIAYSTWDGRMLYVDQMDSEADGSLLLYHTLAKVATRIGAGRFCWKGKERPLWEDAGASPEFLEDWVFLSMNRCAMANFVGSTPIESPGTVVPNGGESKRIKPLHRVYVEETIRETLHQQTTPSNIKLRLAGPEDSDTIARLVKLLAIYEKEPDAVNMGAKDYLVDGYDSSAEPLFYCILADITSPDEASNGGREIAPSTATTAAMGLFYFGYSMVDGRFLYLEDLFCDEKFRGKSVGTTIMKQLALVSTVLDCCQFVWTALDWNAPALSFYDKIGATVNDDLKITRYCGEDLQAFAISRP